MRRRRRSPRDQGMSRFTAGLIALVLIAVFSYFGFTKANPFASPYRLTAIFNNANNLKPRSPVRIAGVEVGKVTKVEPIESGNGAARVTMEIKKAGLPIHRDAELKIRPRIFLEGNFFVDISPGSPSAPTIPDGGPPIPPTQTSAPVQFGDLLAALQSDTRSDLQTFLKEYSKGISGRGARGFNQFLRTGPDAFRYSAIVNDATLGLEPTKDIQRLLRGQQRTFAALSSNEQALKGLVTDANVTFGAFARQDAALQASLPALRDLLVTGRPALASLNSALPSLRAFAVDALPGVRSSGPTLEAALPFITQARLLVGPAELRGTAAQLRAQLPRLTLLNRRLVPFLGQARLLSSCTVNVLVPFAQSPIPNPDEPGNTNQKVYRQINRGLVGLAGESRLSDGNNQYFHTSGVSGLYPGPLGVPAVRPAPPPDLGRQPPVRRPDVPCETQDPPNLNAPGGPLANFTSKAAKGAPGGTLSAGALARLAPRLRSLMGKQQRLMDAKRKRYEAGFRKLGKKGKP